MEKKDKKNKLLTTGVIIILCVIFAVLFTYGLNKVLAMEGSYPPSSNVEGLTKAPKTNEEAVVFLNRAVKKAENELPKYENSRSFDVDEDSIETSFSDEFSETLKYIRNDFCDALKSDFKPFEEPDFGKDFTSSMAVPNIKSGDILSVDSGNYIYYRCSSCGETSDEPQDSHEECGSTEPFEMKYRDEYEIILDLKVSDKVLKNNFFPRTQKEALALVSEKYEGVLKVDSLDVSYDTLSLTYKVKRLTDELTHINYKKTMTVTANVTFIGEYSSLGSGEIKFVLTENNDYGFTWPSLELNKDEIVLELGGNDNLLATLTCSDPADPDMVVTWTSSDENVVTVDEEGYMKASKTPGEAVIVAFFEFMGKTYSDSCKVYVRTPVESLSINKKKIELNTGDTFTLVTKTSPSDATIQSVKWYSNDESTAKIDENGLVTAVSAGTVTVYALSDDGYYKSSCEVTVK